MDKVYKAEISKLSEYVKQTCERFQVRDEDPAAAEAELSTLHRTIERLMRISAKTTDSKVRAMLARIEQDARQCRDCILERVRTKN